MRADGIVRRFDELGRINIPKEIRTKLFGTKYTDGEPMEIFMDKDDIIIRKFEENKDDVCEWRLCDEEANVYDTSCRNPHILIEGTPKENNYEYCPYCGKKIKVVEQMRITQIGWLKHGDIFTFEGNKYKVGHVIDGTNGYVSCTNIETRKVKRLHIDLDVEVEE